MSKLIDVDIPAAVRDAFKISSLLHTDADVNIIAMAGAMLNERSSPNTGLPKMRATDNVYLEEACKRLGSEGITFGANLVVRAANLSFGVDVFNLEAPQFDWAIFCNFRVAKHRLGQAIGSATLQSPRTFEKNKWTETFKKAGTKGFTVIAFIDEDFERMEELAFENNEGIAKRGSEYSFQLWQYGFRAQNYSFNG
jgi:hypothetical protein